ncbi:hypothetical protein GCM10010339_44960 [Streptomyces alanosinicus]|uniref:Uncharacterized protein n=1 Tax=Streptomyces alanosinicus TaxID=68171 RepID=A0A919D2W5_9ACTN|nr:hypothetical protein GCM10010339_44960 [Streptomyces alanosinicus]
MRGPPRLVAVQGAHQMPGEGGLARAGAARDPEHGTPAVPHEATRTNEKVIEGQRHTGQCGTLAVRRGRGPGSAILCRDEAEKNRPLWRAPLTRRRPWGRVPV